MPRVAIARISADESGSALIPFSIMLVFLMGMIAMAVDFGRAVDEKSKVQAALDSAVLAGAKVTSGQVDRAKAVFASNVSKAIGKSVTPAFVANSDGSVSGTAQVSLANFLGGLYGSPKFTFSLSAKAKSGSSGFACVLLLDPSASQSLLVNSGANVTAPNCEFHVKSTANPAAIFNSQSKIDSKKMCIQGAQIIDNGGTHTNTQLKCTTIADPFASTFPAPSSSSCTYSNLNYNGGTVTLSPGTYCGWVNFNNATNVNFKPGVYVIKSGGWNVNGGTWTGSGVTFFFADTSVIQFNSAVAATLTPPTSGDYQGVIMFEKSGLSKSNLVFDDSKNFNLQGLFYLPSRNVTFNSGSGVTSKQAGMVFNTLILNKTNWTLSPGGRTIPTGGGGGSVVLVN